MSELDREPSSSRRRASRQVGSTTTSSSSTSNLRKWFSTPKSRSHKVKRFQGKVSSRSRERAQEATSEEGVRSARTLKTLFSRPSGASSRTSTDKRPAKPFTPWLPPELWVLVLHHASSPSHPFLSSSLVSPSAPLSFLDFPHSHAHLLSDYKKSIRFKASLTRVCKLWYALGQEVLYEFVWITRAKEAALIAESLSSKAIRDVSAAGGAAKPTVAGKHRQTPSGGLRERPSHCSRLSDVTNFDYNNRGAYTYPYDTRGVGRHIRRLHIETPSLERCSPVDLLTILENAPLLQVYSDYQSIRRTSGISIVSRSSVTSSASSSRPASRGSATSTLPGLPASDSPSASTHVHTFRDYTRPQQRSADQEVLSALLTHPNRGTALRRLSWTNYEYEPQDYEGVIRFYMRVVGPKLEMAKENLEFLELTLCTKDLRGMGSGAGGEGFLHSLLNMAAPNPGLNASQLTSLSASLTSTVTTTITSSSPAGTLSRSSSSSTLRSVGSAIPLDLPALRSLKVTLDNATFHVLSTWDMPALQNLSVISADFSYAGEGFAQFFNVHGSKLVQLELGHSTGAIEEFWLTSPPHLQQQQLHPHQQQQPGGGPAGQGWTFGSSRIPLAEWCPNLREFICSADAEWNWQNPDWIAPHVLLPAHPTLQFIGVRDMEKRISEGLGRVEWRDLAALREGRGMLALEDGVGHEEDGYGSGGGADGDVDDDDDADPFFMLLEQFGSLLRREAFPGLLYVRDMSWTSGLMRKSGRVALRGGVASVDGLSPASVVDVGGGDVAAGAGAASEVSPSGLGAANPSHQQQPTASKAWTGFFASLIMSGSNVPRPVQQQPSSSSSSYVGESSTFAADRKPPLNVEYLREVQQGRRVLRFWMKVLKLCRERGVWLEDCEGVNVTMADLRRAAKV